MFIYLALLALVHQINADCPSNQPNASPKQSCKYLKPLDLAFYAPVDTCYVLNTEATYSIKFVCGCDSGLVAATSAALGTALTAVYDSPQCDRQMYKVTFDGDSCSGNPHKIQRVDCSGDRDEDGNGGNECNCYEEPEQNNGNGNDLSATAAADYEAHYALVKVRRGEEDQCALTSPVTPEYRETAMIMDMCLTVDLTDYEGGILEAGLIASVGQSFWDDLTLSAVAVTYTCTDSGVAVTLFQNQNCKGNKAESVAVYKGCPAGAQLGHYWYFEIECSHPNSNGLPSGAKGMAVWVAGVLGVLAYFGFAF